MSAFEKLISITGSFLSEELRGSPDSVKPQRRGAHAHGFYRSVRSSEETRPPSEGDLREFLTCQMLRECGLPVSGVAIKYVQDGHRQQLFLKPHGWSAPQLQVLQRRADRIKLLLVQEGIEVSEIYCSSQPDEPPHLG